MKVKHSLVGLTMALSGAAFSSPVFATSYSYDVDVQFNFNSMISVTLTSADIQILDLAPGTSSDSNIVDISISTNSAAGYNLSATAGWADNATTNMTHTNGTNTFTSIATNASLASLTTDNTWGYSFSDTKDGNDEYIWGNFSGLPLYTATAKELKNTNVPASDIVGFKINAKASTAQPAGDYTNKINFIAVANVPPRSIEDVMSSTQGITRDVITGHYKMQDMTTSICNLVEDTENTTILTDTRDGTNYHVGELGDDRCWLLDNLALDPLASGVSITTANTNASTEAITNFLQGSASQLHNGWSTNAVAVEGNTSVYDSPRYNAASKDITRADFVNPTDPLTEADDWKYGIYYNYCAASIGTYCYAGGSGLDKPNTAIDAEYDICPSGWRMPTGTDWDWDDWEAPADPINDEYVILYRSDAYRGISGGETILRKALRFPLAGYFENGSARMQNDQAAYIWSSSYTRNGEMMIFQWDLEMWFNSYKRNQGNSVRCIAKTGTEPAPSN